MMVCLWWCANALELWPCFHVKVNQWFIDRSLMHTSRIQILAPVLPWLQASAAVAQLCVPDHQSLDQKEKETESNFRFGTVNSILYILFSPANVKSASRPRIQPQHQLSPSCNIDRFLWYWSCNDTELAFSNIFSFISFHYHKSAQSATQPRRVHRLFLRR